MSALPIYLADPHAQVLPHAYVCMTHSQRCLNCALTHKWSTLYAKTHMRSTLGAGKYITNLRPLTRPEYNLPIETIQATETTTPFCHQCAATVTLSHLPPLPITEPAARPIAGHGPAAATAAAGLGPTKREPRKPATIDDLLDL